MIVDTGTPTSASGMALNGPQGWAAEFITNQDWQVQSIEGFINADTGNPDSATFTIALYGNGANDLPDTKMTNCFLSKHYLPAMAGMDCRGSTLH